MSLNGCLLLRETGNPKSGASYRLKQVGRGPGGAEGLPSFGGDADPATSLAVVPRHRILAPPTSEIADKNKSPE